MLRRPRHDFPICVDSCGKRRLSLFDHKLVPLMDGDSSPGHFADIAQAGDVIPVTMREDAKFNFFWIYAELIKSAIEGGNSTPCAPINKDGSLAAQEKTVVDAEGNTMKGKCHGLLPNTLSGARPSIKQSFIYIRWDVI